jgi:hypothetical protein
MKSFGRLFLTFVALAGLSVQAQEPGQTPRPKGTEPLREPTEEELVKLDKEFPAFAGLPDDAPFAFAGNVIIDARRDAAARDQEKAYDYVLAFAKHQPIERLKKYSLKDVPIENLYRPIRQDYLRELIHIDGRLSLVLPLKPTKSLKELEQVEQLHEIWVVPKGSTKLVCLVVSELPEGVKPGENQNLNVSFDAYYFMLWHYETRQAKDPANPDKKQWERAPLFLGKTFEVRGPATEEATGSSSTMLYGVAGGLLALLLASIGMIMYFRRGDREIQSAARQKIESTVSFEDNPEPAAGPFNRIADQF